MPVRASKPVPNGMNTVTTQLFFNGNCGEAIKFYGKAFNATLVGQTVFGPDGKSILHGMIRIGDTNIMLADAFNDGFGSGPANQVGSSMFMYVENSDVTYNQAVKAGCQVIHEITDSFWGDRIGNVRDPYGHIWSIASYKWEFTAEEMAKGKDEWMKSIM